jgi:hypothetical protein
MKPHVIVGYRLSAAHAAGSATPGPRPAAGLLTNTAASGVIVTSIV